MDAVKIPPLRSVVTSNIHVDEDPHMKVDHPEQSTSPWIILQRKRHRRDERLPVKTIPAADGQSNSQMAKSSNAGQLGETTTATYLMFSSSSEMATCSKYTNKIVRTSSFPIHQITRETKTRYSDPSPKFCFGDLFPHLSDEPTSKIIRATKAEASETSSGSIAVDQRSNDETHAPNTASASLETHLQLLADEESSKPIKIDVDQRSKDETHAPNTASIETHLHLADEESSKPISKIDVDQRSKDETHPPNTASIETHVHLLADQELSKPISKMDEPIPVIPDPATVSDLGAPTPLVGFMEYVDDERYVESWGNTESQTLLTPPQPQVINPLNSHNSPHPDTLNSHNSPHPDTLTLNDSILQIMKAMENLKKTVERMGPKPAHQEESDIEMGIEKKCLKLKSVGTMCWIQIRNAVVDFACKTFWMWIVFLIFGSWALSALKKFFREE